MNKPPAPPQMPGQWLATSISWALGGAGGLTALLAWSLQLLPPSHVHGFWLGAAAVVHGVLWWKAVAPFCTLAGNADAGLLTLAAWAWMVALLLFQFLSLLLLLEGFGLALGLDSGSATGYEWGVG